MAVYDGSEHHYDDEPADAPRELDTHPAGESLDQIVICDGKRPSAWILGDPVDLVEAR